MMYISAYRAMERPQLGMYILMVSMGCNTFLNWMLIFGNLGAPAMGVEGAALATLISRGVELVILAVHIKCSRFLSLKPGLLLRPGMEMARRFVRYGGPVVCNETMWGLGTGIIPTIMGHMENSQEILAAYTLAGNVEKICMVLGFGIHHDWPGNRRGPDGQRLSGGAGPGHSGVSLRAWNQRVPGAVCTVHRPGVGVPAVQAVPRGQPDRRSDDYDSGAGDTPEKLQSGQYCGRSPGRRGRDRRDDHRPGPSVAGVSIPLCALAGLVLRLDIFWVYLCVPSESIVKFFIGLHRLRSGRWINDVTGTADRG